MQPLALHIESLLFSAEQPLTLPDLQQCLSAVWDTEIPFSDVAAALEEVQVRYQSDAFSIEIIGIAEGYRFLTKGAYHGTVGTYLKQTTKRKLSQAALETLSIIAYRQPIAKGELEDIRGVSCDYSIQKLLEKELISIAGRSEGPGKPLLYATSPKFMDYFGLKSLQDLPKLKDFDKVENSIGEPAPITEESPQA